MLSKLFIGILTIAMLMAVQAASAQEGSSFVLKRIKERGVINMGHRESSIPFSFIDESGEPTGYHVEICDRFVDEIRKTLDKPDIKVKHVPITSQTRIPLIANGTLDMACGSASNTLTRSRQVDYLAITYIGGTRLAHKKGSGITEIEDMDGKVIALAAGTTDERSIKRLIKEKGLSIKVVPVKDHSQAWLAVETGRVDAYANDPVMLAGLIGRSKAPGEYEISGRLLSYDPYGIMVPRNDSTYRLIGNKMLADMMRSGELLKLYNKWYNSKKTNLSVPISETLATAFRIQALPN